MFTESYGFPLRPLRPPVRFTRGMLSRLYEPEQLLELTRFLLGDPRKLDSERLSA